MSVGGVFFGLTVGLCVAPLWLMLFLPMRVMDMLKAGTIRLCGWALTMGALWGSLPVICPERTGLLAAAGLLMGGVFVGMLASALTEALEVIPVLYKKMHLYAEMKNAAWALALGKMCGAFLAVMTEM